MALVHLLLKIYASNPKIDLMPLVRVVIGSDLRATINWRELAQTLVNRKSAHHLYRTSLWRCRPETMCIHNFLVERLEGRGAFLVGYNLTMLPSWPSGLSPVAIEERSMGHMSTLTHLEAFNPRAILAWAVYAKADVARMVTYGFALWWAMGQEPMAGRAVCLAKMAKLKQKDLLIEKDRVRCSWPNADLHWSCDTRKVDMNKVNRWNAWVMDNATAWGVKPGAEFK